MRSQLQQVQPRLQAARSAARACVPCRPDLSAPFSTAPLLVYTSLHFSFHSPALLRAHLSADFSIVEPAPPSGRNTSRQVSHLQQRPPASPHGAG